MNIALIFAGGTGVRMKTSGTPKQFLEVHGKPVIIHTLEKFDSHSEIECIIVVCLEEYIDILHNLVRKNMLQKIKYIVPGGKTGQESIYNGLCCAKKYYTDDTIVLIHDGVRPLITHELISKNIQCTQKYNNAVSSSRATETIIKNDMQNNTYEVLQRKDCLIAKAPQTFRLGHIYDIHSRSIQDQYFESIDSATLMKHYGEDLHFVPCDSYNIKITMPSDYYIFRALLNAREGQQVLGL